MSEFNRTVESPVWLDESEFPPEIRGSHERVWGMQEGTRNRTTFEQMSSRDRLIFYHDGEIFSSGRVGVKFEGREYGDIFWDTPSSPLSFTIEDYDLLAIPIDVVRESLGYQSGFHPRGPIRVSDRSMEILLGKFGSIRDFLSDYRASERPDKTEQASDYIRPNRADMWSSRIIRNTQIVNDLKQDYDYHCQVCDDQRRMDLTGGYAEGHHLQPLGSPHDGPDVKENIIILCPNHHADFDYGMILIDPATLEIEHAYDDEINGSELTFTPNHQVDPEFLRYHNQNIADW